LLEGGKSLRILGVTGVDLSFDPAH